MFCSLDHRLWNGRHRLKIHIRHPHWNRGKSFFHLYILIWYFIHRNGIHPPEVHNYLYYMLFPDMMQMLIFLIIYYL